MCSAVFIHFLQLLEPVSAVTYTLASIYLQEPMESFKEDTQAFCLLPRRKVAACTILVYRLEFMLYHYQTLQSKYLANDLNHAVTTSTLRALLLAQGSKCPDLRILLILCLW